MIDQRCSRTPKWLLCRWSLCVAILTLLVPSLPFLMHRLEMTEFPGSRAGAWLASLPFMMVIFVVMPEGALRDHRRKHLVASTVAGIVLGVMVAFGLYQALDRQ